MNTMQLRSVMSSANNNEREQQDGKAIKCKAV